MSRGQLGLRPTVEQLDRLQVLRSHYPPPVPDLATLALTVLDEGMAAREAAMADAGKRSARARQRAKR